VAHSPRAFTSGSDANDSERLVNPFPLEEMPMLQQQPRRSHRRILGVVLPLALLGSLIPIASVSAAVSVNAATGGSSISADTNGAGGTGVYTTLIGPSIVEDAAGQVAIGSVILTAPAGFQFNPTLGSVTATPGGTGCAGMAVGTVVPTAATVTIPITAASTAPCTLTVSGLQVRPTAGLLPVVNPGHITNTGTSGPGGATNYGTLMEVPGAPVLTFTSGSINSTTGGATLAPAPTFHDEDAWGNDRSGDSVALAIKSGTGTAGAILTCTTNPGTTNATGDVTFNGCSIDKNGNNYVLRATTGSAGVDTNAFNISVGPQSKLVFLTYPAATTPSLLTPQPSVAVTDAGGNIVSSDNSTVVTLAISSNTGTFSCTGGLSKTVTAGVATFSGCTQTSTGSYTLTATSSPVYTPVTGPTFNVSSGTANKLAFCWGTAIGCPSTPPATITGGVPFSTQPTIRVQDAAGNTVVTDNTTVVALSIAAGTPTSGGPGTLTCTGGNSMTVTAGVATFSGCSIDKPGVGYKLNANSSPVLTPAQSNAFNVVAGPATKLTFIAQPPATASSGTPFPSSVQVAITDAGGNVITSGITATIALSIGTNPGGGSLSCTGGNSATTVNGVATFNGCAITGSGNGYTLVATATSTTPTTTLTPATSTPINVTSVGASISISTSPSLNGATPPTAVIVWARPVVFTVHFTGNGANRSFQLQTTKDQVTWSTIANLTTNASGDASFTYRPSDNRYYRAVFAGAADLSAANSPTVRVVVRSIILLRPTNFGAVKEISLGTSRTFTATARPNRPELPQARANFVVYRFSGGSWHKVLDQVVPVDVFNGKASLTITFSSRAKYYVRAQLVPTPVNANSGWTPIERYDVV
jgi:hypothetical protein